MQTRLRLFADSAGRCQKPDCLLPLFVDSPSATVHFAEAAHIVAASDSGPRGDQAVTVEERAAFDNLILLCSNCHAIVDKVEPDYPTELLQQ